MPRRARVHGSAHTRRLRAVRELQPLDTGQAVDTITPGHQVGDDHRVAIDHHAVVGGHPREHRRVIAVGAIEDFPNDHQLARVVGAIEHERHHRLHAVETGDLRAGAVAVGAHADAHIQPLVTVEDVVATTAFDQVAAAAAEDDVAAIVERRPGSSRLDRPLIRLMLVSTLPVAPLVGRLAASSLSPRRKSPWDEPDRPSMMSKRTSADAPEPGTGGTSKKRSL